MPRKRKTMTGADAQDIKSVPGRRYGEGVEQQAMQRAMPAPDGMQPTTPEPPPMEAMPTSRRADPDQLTAFLQQHNPNLLAGTGMPDQPVTAGLSTGPGGGPEMLPMTGQSTPLARTLTELSAATGNPMFQRLAQRAGLV